MIISPTLPPLPGYVEVEVGGRRVYRNVRTGILLEQEPPRGPSEMEQLQEDNKMLQAQLQAQVDRSDFIEDCIAEMATVVYGGV